jgi:Fe2+ transport system protein FeoA
VDNLDSESLEKTDTLNLTKTKQGKFYSLVGIDSSPKRRSPRRRHGRHGHGPHRGSRMKRRSHRVMARLLDLGLTKGCTFEVIQCSDDGPILLQIRGTRIALGHFLASKLLVREVK